MTVVTKLFKALALGIAWAYAFIILMLLGLVMFTNAMIHFVS